MGEERVSECWILVPLETIQYLFAKSFGQSDRIRIDIHGELRTAFVMCDGEDSDWGAG